MGTKTRGASRRCAVLSAIIVAFAATPALAGGGTGTAQAVALAPLSIVNSQDLDFGRLIAGATAGTVSIDANSGARTQTGGVTAAGGTPTPGQFFTVGQNSFLVFINTSAPPTLTRAGGGATMTLTALTLNGGNLRLFPANNIIELRYGGTLAVAANQLTGTYTGTYTVTVTYF